MAENQNKPQLTISLLISNRPDSIRKCLDSLRPIMEKISCELILVDTSKNPDINKVLWEYTDKVYEFEWCDDFSKARNIGLKKATGEWFLFLDDDEWFVEIDELVDFFRTGEYKEYGYAHYQVRNFYDPSYTYYSDAWVSRMIRIDEDTEFRSKIHEYMYPVRGEYKYIYSMVYHSGYIFATEEKKRAHFERNSKLLMKMIAEEPQNLRWKIQMAQEYRSVKEYDTLCEFCEKCLEEMKDYNSANDSIHLGTFYVAYIEAYLLQKKYAKAKEICQRAKADKRNTLLCAAFVELALADIAFHEEAWEEAKLYIQSYFDLQKDIEANPAAFEEMSRALIVQEAYDDMSIKKAYSILIACDLKLNHSTELLEKYYPRLEWDKDVIYAYLGIEQVFVWAMATMEYIPLFVKIVEDAYRNPTLRDYISRAAQEWSSNEDAFYKVMHVFAEIEIDDWYIWYARMIVAHHDKDVKAVEKAIANIFKETDDIFNLPEKIYEVADMYAIDFPRKYLAVSPDKYTKKSDSTTIMLLESEEEKYEQLVQRFHDFTIAVLEYYLDIFQDDAFEGEMELLPAEAKAAVYLNQMFSRDYSDWKGKLDDLKNCAKEYPILSTNVKRLIKFFGEQMKEEKAQAANFELLQMVELMKDKIRIMSEQGMQTEALSILSQVRGLAPADRELARMEDELTGRLDEKNILLSVSLLCSGRSETTIKCLESLQQIREKIPCEVIIVDTGCDAVLRSKLANYADVITSFTWCNDFAKARNVGLALARGEWFLYLDDDEWFSDCEEIIEFFTRGTYKKYGAASYIQRNYLDMQGSQYTDSWVPRMIKLDNDTQFVSRIHEYLAPVKGNTLVLHSIVEHYGYVYETEEALMAHYERNSSLLKQMIEEEPEELRWYMLLAQEYRTVCMWQELYDLGTAALALVEDETDLEAILAIGSFYGAQILAMKELGENARGLEICQKAMKDSRNTELFQVFCTLWMSWFLYWLGDYSDAIVYAENYLKWTEYFKDKEDVLATQRIAPFVADCFDTVMKKQVYSIIICAGLRMNNTEYLAKYMDALEWKQNNIYVFEDIADSLIKAICDMGYRKVFYRMIQIVRNQSALNEHFWGKVEEWRSKGVDVTNIDNIDKFGIRKHTQKQLTEIVESLMPVNAIIKNLVETQNTEQLTAILSEAQKVAISLGTAIENALGLGTKAVSILEEYCEVLWNIHEAKTLEEQSTAVEKLAELIASEREEILNFPIKKVAVFLPYKASMWDSLESVWMAARDDEMCDDYVVPIPYFDKNGDGTFKEGHYEGNDYPNYVMVYDWRKIDLASMRPDTIFIHNPYDEGNHVTSVHPDYYSYRLKEYTDKLVYIPYFVTNGGINELNCRVSAILYADKVIIQNEEQKETYKKVYMELKGESQLELETALGIKDEGFWKKLEKEADEKFLPLGSPKFDKVANTTRENVEIPKSWERLITREDGSRKKVILYNTTVSALLKRSDEMIKKIKSTLSVFKEQEDVVLLWRPHPLNRTALEFSRPDLHEEYLRIIENYKSEGWGIYDDTVDFHRAIAISDAYYGDGGSTVPLYKATGKPIMIQNVEILN